MQILSWNIKGFAGAVQYGGNASTVLQQIAHAFDLIAIYEVPNSGNGNLRTNAFVGLLNALGGRNYAHFLVSTGGLGNEDDQIAVIYDQNTTAVVNTTAARRGGGFAGGRAPAYFNVTERANGHTQEFCAWHAPAPGEATNQLIAQGWQAILRNSQDNDQNPLTGVAMGDFNAVLTVPNRGPGSFLVRQIALGSGTTLRPGVTVSYPNASDYRTTSLYDQFYVNTGNIAVNNVGIYDVIDRIANDAAPLTGLFGRQYNTPKKAYTFYYQALSDHLPVALAVTL